MHECPWCGQECDCDGEDTWLEAPDDCTCGCGGPDVDGEDDMPNDAGFICKLCGNEFYEISMDYLCEQCRAAKELNDAR